MISVAINGGICVSNEFLVNLLYLIQLQASVVTASRLQSYPLEGGSSRTSQALAPESMQTAATCSYDSQLQQATTSMRSYAEQTSGHPSSSQPSPSSQARISRTYSTSEGHTITSSRTELPPAESRSSSNQVVDRSDHPMDLSVKSPEPLDLSPIGYSFYQDQVLRLAEVYAIARDRYFRECTVRLLLFPIRTNVSYAMKEFLYSLSLFG